MSTRKTSEGRVAKPQGGLGVPMTVWAQNSILEASHPTLYVQVSSQEKLPAWVGDAMKQAETLASFDEVPVVVLHQDGTQDEDALVVMRLKDFAGDSAEKQPPNSEHRDESLSKQVVNIWTEGACQGSSGIGAWAAAIYDGEDLLKQGWGTELEATSRQMQLLAAIEALDALEEPRRVSLHSDSPHLVHAFQRGWVTDWERNGWRRVKDWQTDTALWRVLLALTRHHEVKWRVAGQAGVSSNVRCHALVLLAMARAE